MPPAVDSLVDQAFRWDGTSSDIAQQLYRRNIANDSTAPKLAVDTTSLPDVIQSRLTKFDVKFDDLPVLLQRALIWDSGFVLTEQDEFVRVQTLNGISMAGIAVSASAYRNTAKCNVLECTQPDNAKWLKNQDCSGSNMLKATLCFVDVFRAGQDPRKSMWATGGIDTDIPMFLVLNHSWIDAGIQYEVAAIHTARRGLEPLYGQCAINAQDTSARGTGALVIPCGTPNTLSSTLRAQMKPPSPGKIVSAWLENYVSKNKPSINRTTPSTSPTIPKPTLSTDDKSTTTDRPQTTSSSSTGINLLFIVIPVVVVVCLILLAVHCWYRRRRERDSSMSVDTPSRGANPAPLLSPLGPHPRRGGGVSGAGLLATGSSATRSSHLSLDLDREAAYSAALKILLGDPGLTDKKIASEEIQFADQVSAGGYGEVWVGYYKQQIVAIKRLLRSKYQSPHDFETFALEIQLSAKLHHPNIVRFIGASWDNLDNLLMVMEYLPAGDLANVLRSSGESLTWLKHKLPMARALFSAVAYLHTQTPAIIHRDIKSKNVLLSDALEPKLIDFGVSRRKMDETMTAGVGTPFWTAPEVLQGDRYTEKSDIYSIGVLLTELDTHQIPYYDVKRDEEGMTLLKIISEVVAGKLRPSVTPECPDYIRNVIVRCLRQDPDTRPKAQEVLWMLV